MLVLAMQFSKGKPLTTVATALSRNNDYLAEACKNPPYRRAHSFKTEQK